MPSRPGSRGGRSAEAAPRDHRLPAGAGQRGAAGRAGGSPPAHGRARHQETSGTPDPAARSRGNGVAQGGLHGRLPPRGTERERGRLPEGPTRRGAGPRRRRKQELRLLASVPPLAGPDHRREPEAWEIQRYASGPVRGTAAGTAVLSSPAVAMARSASPPGG